MLSRRKLQVFVSSTYSDLMEERQAAVAAILKAGHIPAGMELFSSGDQSQLDVIKRWIESSDAFMLILGTRYGSVEKRSKTSYTELEYDYAVASGKPFFALVMSEEAIDKKLRSQGASALEQNNPYKLKLFREKVLSKLCSIYSDSRDIRAHIYENLIDLMDRQELEGWVRGSLATDPQPLYEKIAELTAENERLKGEMSGFRLRQSADVFLLADERHFNQLQRFLDNTSLTIPAAVSRSGAEVKTSALKLLLINRDLFASGVTTTLGAAESDKWFAANLYSLLMNHKVMNCTSAGGASKRYALSESGRDFLAWYDRITVGGQEARVE